MADVQDGAHGPRGNGSAVELQLENVARALGEDIDHAQIHECGMAHIIFDPQISGGPRKESHMKRVAKLVEKVGLHLAGLQRLSGGL